MEINIQQLSDDNLSELNALISSQPPRASQDYWDPILHDSNSAK